MHIWAKKEIENYAINPDVILRYITHNKQQGSIDKDLLNGVIQSIADEMIEVVAEKNRVDGAMFKEIKDVSLLPYDIISGREFFNVLSLWTQEEYGITISARQLVPYFNINDVPHEIKLVISEIMRLS